MVLYLFQRSGLAVCFPRLASGRSPRVLSLRSPIGVVFQLCAIVNCLFSWEAWTRILTARGFTVSLVLTVADKGPSSEIQERFSSDTSSCYWNLLLRIVKRLFRKALWEGGLDWPLVIGLGTVRESLAAFCPVCVQSAESSVRNAVSKYVPPRYQLIGG